MSATSLGVCWRRSVCRVAVGNADGVVTLGLSVGITGVEFKPFSALDPFNGAQPPRSSASRQLARKPLMKSRIVFIIDSPSLSRLISLNGYAGGSEYKRGIDFIM